MDNTILVSAADHAINSVTVFKSDKAEIVRTIKLNLEAGQNKIEIKGLSSSIDTHSVRVSNLGTARLFDVVCTLDSDADSSVDLPPHLNTSKNEIIRVLQAKKSVLESEKRTREYQKEVLLSYGKTLGGEHVTPAVLTQFLHSFAEQSDKNTYAIAEFKEKIYEIDQEIEKALTDTIKTKGSSRGKVTVVIVSDDAAVVNLKLSYIVANARWRPTYELHASTENGKASSSVSLHYRARITQSTGEDWNNTSLTLSTITSGTSAKTIPELLPVKIRSRLPPTPAPIGMGMTNPYNSQVIRYNMPLPQSQARMAPPPPPPPPRRSAPPPVRSSRQRAARRRPPPDGVEQSNSSRHDADEGVAFELEADGGPDDDDEAEYQELLQLQQEFNIDSNNNNAPTLAAPTTTVVTETPIAISYSVAGKSTIPSDDVDHQVSVAVLPFEAKISYVASPRVEPVVYLQCQVENKSEYRLLSGPVSVILDDSYVSKTNIQDINTGDTFTCTLGDDSSLKLTYLRSATTVKSNPGAFSEAFATTTYAVRVSIHNKHAFAISDLVVREVIPTSDDKQVKVILRKPKGLAEVSSTATTTAGGSSEGEGKQRGSEVVDLGQDGLKVCWQEIGEGKTRGGEKEGKFEWRWKVDAGAKVVLEAEWEVKAPADLQLYETRVESK